MPRRQEEVEMMGPSDRVFVDPEELPSDAIVTEDGDVLVPTDDPEKADFILGDDGMIYATADLEDYDEDEDEDDDEGYDDEDDEDYDYEDEEDDFSDEDGYE
jgi:hypothetical protein